MTQKEIEKLSLKQCHEIIGNFYKDHNINMYFAISKQADELMREMEETPFSLTDENVKDIVNIAEKMGKISKILDEIKAKIDTRTFLEEKKKRLEAKEATLEHLAKHGLDG
jgi:hypothetical protein